MQYTWFIGSLIFLFIWLLFYFYATKDGRKEMLYVSAVTSLFGFTEPLFVPEYWNPPTLFNLAQTTSFDIESIIFAFSIGGIASIVYELIRKGTKHTKLSKTERHRSKHRYHNIIIMSSPLVFIFLYLLVDWNIIYTTIVSLFIGGLFALYCRPDLKYKMIGGSVLFLTLYFVFFSILNLFYPNWTTEVWNFSELTGVMLFKVPLEELLFALSLGFLWSGLYEHLNWYKLSIGKN